MKAAIIQGNFVYGGNAQVTVAAAEVFNSLGTIPDIYCYRGMDPDDVEVKLNRRVSFSLHRINEPGPKGFGALKGPLLNWKCRRKLEEYDVVFNAHSFLHFLPADKRYVHYMLLPRKVEVLHSARRAGWIRKWLYDVPLYAFYYFERIHAESCYLVLSNYALRLLHEHYRVPSAGSVRVFYPPVNLGAFWCENSDREPTIISVGNFDPTKNQLAQIELAALMPDFSFWIVGSTQLNPEYFAKCKEAVAKRNVANVQLFPDLPWESLKSLLVQSKFFLHTKRGEHFGITAVEATAAGCIPIVHNSGGQRETVPLDRLRFNSMEEVPDIIGGIREEEVAVLRSRLQEHIKKFDEQNFRRNLRTIVQDLAG